MFFDFFHVIISHCAQFWWKKQDVRNRKNYPLRIGLCLLQRFEGCKLKTIRWNINNFCHRFYDNFNFERYRIFLQNEKRRKKRIVIRYSLPIWLDAFTKFDEPKCVALLSSLFVHCSHQIHSSIRNLQILGRHWVFILRTNKNVALRSTNLCATYIFVNKTKKIVDVIIFR